MAWVNSRLRKYENSARAQDRANAAALTVRSFGVTIYIYVGIALGKQLPSLGSKNMSSEVEAWTH